MRYLNTHLASNHAFISRWRFYLFKWDRFLLWPRFFHFLLFFYHPRFLFQVVLAPRSKYLMHPVRLSKIDASCWRKRCFLPDVNQLSWAIVVLSSEIFHLVVQLISSHSYFSCSMSWVLSSYITDLVLKMEFHLHLINCHPISSFRKAFSPSPLHL